MSQSYQKMPVERIVNEAIYQKDIEYCRNADNQLKIVNYLKGLSPSMESISVVQPLLKFFRFPAVICLFPLYERIGQLPLEQQEELKEKLMEVAAFVNSLLKTLEIEHLPEIQFIFKWGQAKKKYKMTLSPPEIQFAKFIAQLCKLKREIQQLVINKQDPALKQKKVNEFLGMNLERECNKFETSFIDHIKRMSSQTIMKIEAQQLETIVKKNPAIFSASKPGDQSSNKKPEKEEMSIIKPEKSKQSEPQRVEVDKRQKKDDFTDKKEEKVNKEDIKSDKKQVKIDRKVQNSKPEQRKFEKKDKLKDESQTFLCCRTYFYDDEQLEQPQSLRIEYKNYNYPFKDNQDQVPGKHEKIKRTICGFLNSQGGIIYFGVKEQVDSKRRKVGGFYVSEKGKLNFRKDIFEMLKDIQPQIGIKCEIKWVPICSRSSQFLAGKYVAKVIIGPGAKDQLYSYLRGWGDRREEKFAFRTQNEILIKDDPQQILRIFKNRVLQKERPIRLLHNHPCIDPLLGKQVFNDQNESLLKDYFPTVVENEQMKKKFKQKETGELLVSGISEQELIAFLIGQGIKAKKTEKIDAQDVFLQLENNRDLSKLGNKGFVVTPAFSRLSYRQTNEEQKQILKLIIQQYEPNQKWLVKHREQDRVMVFIDAKAAAIFYKQARDMQLDMKFTSQA